MHLLAYGTWLGAIVWTTAIAVSWVQRIHRGNQRALGALPCSSHPAATCHPAKQGIVMFKNLPRQTFGRLQSKLFPMCGAWEAGRVGGYACAATTAVFSGHLRARVRSAARLHLPCLALTCATPT